jgi:Protein of unknown function (DUF3300)
LSASALVRVLALTLLVATADAQQENPVDAPVAPPSAPPQRSAAELEKLVAPIALYPDTLLAVMLPAAAYPLDVVIAAQYLADHGSSAKVDDQPWDVNVKAVAGVPTALAKMEKDLTWTLELGQAFIEQPLDLMDAIQRLRAEAKTAGTLKTTPEQVVKVGEATVEREYEGETIYVTNSVITIEPAKPEVIYVPVYDPVKTYEDDDDDDDDDDDAEAFMTFAAAVTVGAIIANNCDWCYGGVMIGGGGMIIVGGGGHPPYYPPPPYYRPPPYHPPPGYRPPPPGYRPPGVPPRGERPPGGGHPTAGTSQRWQPDQNRLGTSGVPGAQPSASTREARGWGSSGSPSAQPSTPRASTGASRPAPTTSPSVSSAGRASSSSSAFGGVSSGARERDSSRRGAASRGGRGGGGRGGGGGRR